MKPGGPASRPALSKEAKSITREDLIGWARPFCAKKHLGQHFLIDPAQLYRIAQALELSPGDTVLEIGPGLGFLTRFLADSGALVYGVELDQSAVGYLRNLKLPDTSVVHGDILQLDLKELPGERIKVAGNVPYQITAKILVHLFGEIGSPSPWLNKIERLVMTVQKEVAERFTAAPGTKDYSQVTLLASYFSEPRIIDIVPPSSFLPAPEVTSAVVYFKMRESPPVQCGNLRLLRQVIAAGFNQRRKMLRNNLSFLNLAPDQVAGVLASLSIDPLVRAERLSLAQFAKLTDALAEFKRANPA